MPKAARNVNEMSKQAQKRYTNVSESLDVMVVFGPSRKGEVTLPNASLRLGDHPRAGSIVPSTNPNTYTREQFNEWYNLMTAACERLGCMPALAAKSWSFKQAIDRPHTVTTAGVLKGASVIGALYAACALQDAYKRAEKVAAVDAAVVGGSQVYVNVQPARKDGTLVAYATVYDAYKFILRQEPRMTGWGKDLGANPSYIKGLSIGADWHSQFEGTGKLEERVMNSKLAVKLAKQVSIGAPQVRADAPKMSTISNREAVSMAKEAGAPTSVTTGSGCSARSKAFLVNNGLISSE